MANSTIRMNGFNYPAAQSCTEFGNYTGHYQNVLNYCFRCGDMVYLGVTVLYTDNYSIPASAVICKVPSDCTPSGKRRIPAYIVLSGGFGTLYPYACEIESTGYVYQGATNTCKGISINGWYYL